MPCFAIQGAEPSYKVRDVRNMDSNFKVAIVQGHYMNSVIQIYLMDSRESRYIPTTIGKLRRHTFCSRWIYSKNTIFAQIPTNFVLLTGNIPWNRWKMFKSLRAKRRVLDVAIRKNSGGFYFHIPNSPQIL